jgi:hypothetical protein
LAARGKLVRKVDWALVNGAINDTRRALVAAPKLEVMAHASDDT